MGALVGSSIAAEIGLRTAGYPAFAAIDTTEHLLVLDERLGWRNKPSAELTWGYIRPAPKISIDSEGYRQGVDWPNEDGPRVVCVGDSTTFCAELNDNETWPSSLGVVLGEGVLNAGVRGYSTLQSARMLDQCLDRFPTIRTAVYTYCANDLDENLTPRSHPPLVAPTARLDPLGGVVEVEPANPVVPWGEQPPGTPRLSARILNPLRRRSVLLHQISLVVVGAPPHLVAGGSPPVLDQADPRVVVLEALLARMKANCERRSVQFVVTSFTSGEAPLPTLREICARLGILVVDTSSKFHGGQLPYLARTAQGGHDPHYGPKGASTFAAAVADAISSPR